MGGYKVNIAELGRLIQTLEDGAEQVRDANKTLAAVGQLEMLGNETLKGEAHRFEEKWDYGLGKLDEAAKGVIERLESAKKNYAALEAEYDELFGKIFPDDGVGAGISATGDQTASGIPGGGYTGGIQDVLGGTS